MFEIEKFANHCGKELTSDEVCSVLTFIACLYFNWNGPLACQACQAEVENAVILR